MQTTQATDSTKESVDMFGGEEDMQVEDENFLHSNLTDEMKAVNNNGKIQNSGPNSSNSKKLEESTSQSPEEVNLELVSMPRSPKLTKGLDSENKFVNLTQSNI